jgi:4-hydroxythreonine-4-phosphate dehydrogenase
LGTEELEIIIPAVDKAKNENQIFVAGPYPADGFFGSNQYKQFDGILAMYHDQGLVPFKYASFDSGVNYTAGLPFVRTSPDHGTAYAIAGKNLASEQSMRNALYLAIDIWNQRNQSHEINENPLPYNPGKRERFRIDF